MHRQHVWGLVCDRHSCPKANRGYANVDYRVDHLGADCWVYRQQVVDKEGKGLWLNMALGIVGAIVGGIIFSVFGAGGVTGVNLYSLIVAVIGSIVVLWVYNAFSGRRTM